MSIVLVSALGGEGQSGARTERKRPCTLPNGTQSMAVDHRCQQSVDRPQSRRARFSTGKDMEK